MRERSKRTHRKTASRRDLSSFIFALSVALLFFIPLAFSTAVVAVYSLPKFALLLAGSSLLLALLALYGWRPASAAIPLFKSTQVKLVCAYFAVIAVTTPFSVAPMVSLVGGSSNFMGVITRLCFLICFLGLLVGIGRDEGRLLKALWVVAICGGLVAVYAVAQFFGLEPFAPTSVYTFQTSMGDVIRVCSSLGHSNYLGNFLLYTTPVSAGLALALDKRERLVATLITAISLLALVFSVARGAWVGIILGAIFFAALEWKQLPAPRALNRTTLLRTAAILLLAVISVAGVVALTPASRTIKERVQALLTQGVQSSGRLLLWRDALKMLPAYALTGCGSEGFRKAFLPYKSKEVTRLSQPNNNESSHNSYLDVALSHGLPGFALYIAIIAATLKLLLRARRLAISRNWRLILSGLSAAFVAVLTHNFFIFDHISTGLYFFAFAALAGAAAHIFAEESLAAKSSSGSPQAEAGAATGKVQGKAAAPSESLAPTALRLWMSRATLALAAFAVILALWYAGGLISSERAFAGIFDPAIARNLQAIAGRCREVADSPSPTGAYRLMAARALENYAQNLLSYANSAAVAPAERNQLLTTRSNALQLGIGYAEQSLARTNTPDVNYTALASLAMAYGDKEKLMSAASEAVRSDPNNRYCRWLMAEAFLANGENEAAVAEANLALDLSPDFPNALAVLFRAQAQPDELSARQKRLAQLAVEPIDTGRNITQLVDYARQLAQQGNLHKAKRKLLMAIVRSEADCLECRRELAQVYEKLELYPAAIGEWEKVRRQTTDLASAELIETRLQTLKSSSFEKQK